MLVLYQFAQAGRYHVHDSKFITVVLDTRTGALRYYNWNSKEWTVATAPLTAPQDVDDLPNVGWFKRTISSNAYSYELD